MAKKVFLIHWDGEEAATYAAAPAGAGYDVETEHLDGARACARMRSSPPDAAVIFLTRKPSHGRETALALRSMGFARDIKFLFVGGEPEAIDMIREKMPDAVFSSIGDLVKDLGKIL